MKFTAGFLAVLVAIPQTLAVEFTNNAFAVVAGQPFTLTWSDAVGAVSIILKNGVANDLKDVETLTSGQTSNSYTWTPPSTLATGTYAFEIVDTSGVPNYSQQFVFAGAAATTAESSTTSASSTTSTGSTKALSTLTAITTSTTLTTSTSSSASTSALSSSGLSNSTNSTSSAATAKPTSTKTTGTASTTSSTATSTPSNTTSDSKRLGSPLALILVTAVTLMIFN